MILARLRLFYMNPVTHISKSNSKVASERFLIGENPGLLKVMNF